MSDVVYTAVLAAISLGLLAKLLEHGPFQCAYCGIGIGNALLAHVFTQ